MAVELEKTRGALEREKELASAAKGEDSHLTGENSSLLKEMAELQSEVDKGVEDVTRTIGVGYQNFFDRVVAAGIDLKGHSFDEYCADLAKAMIPEEGNVGEAKRMQGMPRILCNFIFIVMTLVLASGFH